MPPRFQPVPTFFAPTAFSFLGIIYCISIYFGLAEPLCITAGCSLYKNVSIAGISMWIFGSAAFAAILILLLIGLYNLARKLSIICLAGDCVLLLLMSLTSPCLSCLGVAIFFVLVYITLRKTLFAHQTEFRPSRLLFVWCLLFAANALAVAKETLPPTPIAGDPEAPVHIYFSPTCPSCLEAIHKLNYPSGTVAYYATAHSDEDLPLLLSIKEKLNKGTPFIEALDKTLAEGKPSTDIAIDGENILMRLQLLRNRATVIMSAGGAVPYITFKGVPALPEKVENSLQRSHADTLAPKQTTAPAILEAPKLETPRSGEGLLKNGTGHSNSTSLKAAGPKEADEPFGTCTDDKPDCDKQN